MEEFAREAARGAIVRGALAALALLPAAPRADTLAVPGDFSRIQAAIDSAQQDDVVLVEPGTYRENLQLKSGVDVVGRETARTLLAPDDDTQPTVSIIGVVGARFSNFTLVDSMVGVSVSASTGIDVANVVFDRVGDTGFVADANSTVEVVNDVFFQNDKALVRGAGGIEVVSDIFADNSTTITTTLALVDPFQNIRANCFFANRDLTASGSGAGVGAGATVGDPVFVDPASEDFHLAEGSPCIDAGRSTDVDIIDETVADAGAYGGPFADPFPFPVGEPTVMPASAATPSAEIDWPPNLDYRVTNSVTPGGYRVYYKTGGAPADNAPSAYDGSDAGGGTLPSPIEVGAVTSYTLEGLHAESEPPLAPVLKQADGRDQAVQLGWEAAAQATGYRVYYGTSSTTENQVDAGDVTSFVVTGLANGTAYRFAVSAVTQAEYTIAVSALDDTPDRHESALSLPATLPLGAPAEGPLSQELTATPVQIVPVPDLKDTSGCFISAAFRSDQAPALLALRDFRDRFLLTNAAGRWLVAQYYALSPPAARFLDAHAALKPAVRGALVPLVAVALIALDGSRTALMVVLVLAIAGIALRLRVRRFAAPLDAPGCAP